MFLVVFEVLPNEGKKDAHLDFANAASIAKRRRDSIPTSGAEKTMHPKPRIGEAVLGEMSFLTRFLHANRFPLRSKTL